MTATSQSWHATNHVRNGYRIYEILVDIGEEATIDEIVTEFAIRHEGEVLNRNTARARKSEFRKDMKEVEIMNSQMEALTIRDAESRAWEKRKHEAKYIAIVLALCYVSWTAAVTLSKLGYF